MKLGLVKFALLLTLLIALTAVFPTAVIFIIGLLVFEYVTRKRL